MSTRSDDWLDQLFEFLVLPSFSSLGPALRRRRSDWQALEHYDLSGHTVVLTGGTSGIGAEAAKLLAALGARLLIVGRNPDKTHRWVAELCERNKTSAIEAIIADLGEREDVTAAAAEIGSRCAQIDVLIHNAGALFPKRRFAANGTDLAVELMVATPFLLTGLLREPLMRAAPARVLTMSSGGMYTAALSVNELQLPDDRYNGARQYARAKRAQVVLNALWSERVARRCVVFHSLHPGWVDTPGIAGALPGFTRLLSALNLLRSAREGADTLVWLAAADRALQSSGEFWLDRAVRVEHRFESTRQSDTEKRRQRLWDWCETHTGWRFDPQDWTVDASPTAPQRRVS